MNKITITLTQDQARAISTALFYYTESYYDRNNPFFKRLMKKLWNVNTAEKQELN